MNNMDNKTWLKLAALVIIPFAITAVVLLAAGVFRGEEEAPEPEAAGEESGMEMNADVPPVPAGLAYIDGEEMYFIHTEASDADIAGLLSDMMDSPVIHVPALADTPESMRNDVYVFTNGVEGMGPLGYQPDIFVDAPGSEEYTPLREVTLVTWAESAEARELKSFDDLQAAIDAGEVTTEQPGVVINMPFVEWPGGSR